MPPSISPIGKRRLLIVDDHPVMRRGLSQMLEMEPDFEVAGTASSAGEATAALRVEPFDLAIVDISLQGTCGIDLLRELRIHWPDMPVVVLSMYEEPLYARRALRGGARGYVTKQDACTHLVRAIRCALAGDIYVSEAMRASLGESEECGNKMNSR